VLEHNPLATNDCCETCKFALGGDSLHRQLHCGLLYFKAPAAERKVEKLENYPHVDPKYICKDWQSK
jgi:hypothetical protein